MFQNRNDLRIDFRDLNDVTSLNVLDSSDKGKIWYPKLGFTNALGPFQTEMDELTSGVLIRNGTPLREDVTLAIEGIRNNVYWILLLNKYQILTNF